MAEDEYIQFVANYSDWRSVRKIKVDEKTTTKDVLFFLMGTCQGFDKKIEENLKKTVDLDKVDAVLKEIGEGRAKKENEIAALLAFVQSRNVTSVVNELSEKGESKDEKEAIKQACMIYIIRKILGKNNIAVDYSAVKIPGTRMPKGAKKESE